MYTEDQAKKLWCPFARMADCERGFGYNRWEGGEGPQTAYCIASECMAWEWGERERETKRVRTLDTEINGEPIVKAGTLRVVGKETWRYEYTDCDGEGEFELWHRAPMDDSPKVGYCGLARK